jgi:hypothetical protein
MDDFDSVCDNDFERRTSAGLDATLEVPRLYRAHLILDQKDSAEEIVWEFEEATVACLRETKSRKKCDEKPGVVGAEDHPISCILGKSPGPLELYLRRQYLAPLVIRYRFVNMYLITGMFAPLASQSSPSDLL